MKRLQPLTPLVFGRTLVPDKLDILTASLHSLSLSKCSLQKVEFLEWGENLFL